MNPFAIQTIEQSNIPKAEKSAFLRHIDRLTGGAVSKYYGEESSGTIQKKSVMDTGLSVLVDDTEAGIFGGLIGAAEGPEGGLMPSAIATVAGGIMAMMGRGTWAEHVGKNLSASGSTILGYHASRGFLYEKARANAIHAGDFGTDSGKDPIVDYAEKMG